MWHQDRHDTSKWIAEPYQDIYFPSNGRLIRQNTFGTVQPLPLAIMQNPDFHQLFPHITSGTLLINRSIEAGEPKDTSFYEFVDTNSNCLTHVLEDGTIFQQKSGIWYQYMPNTCFAALPYAQYLIHQHLHWINQEANPHILSEDLVTRTPVFRTKIVQAPEGPPLLSSITEISTGNRLSIAHSFFTTIEDSKYIEEWYNPRGELLVIKLPRLGLTFSIKDNDLTKLWCEEPKDFYIDLASVDTSPISNFEHGLLLKNTKGEKKYLIPRCDFIKPIEQEVLTGKVEIAPHDDLTTFRSIPYYMYDVKDDTSINPKSQESEVYLASVFSLSQHYAKAAAILRKYQGHLASFKQYPLFEKDLETIAHQPSISGDMDPNATALNAYASYLIYQNHLNYYSEGDLDPKQALFSLLPRYKRMLRNLAHINITTFSKEDELILTNAIQKPLFAARQQFLKSNPPTLSTQRVTTGEYLVTMQASIDPVDLQAWFSNSKDQNFTLSQETLITRPRLKANFYDYFEVAKHGGLQQKAWLKAACEFAKGREEDQMACFLSAVLENSSLFNEPPSKTLSPEDLLAYAKEQLTIYHTLSSNRISDNRLEEIALDAASAVLYFPALPPIETPITTTLHYQFPELPTSLSHDLSAYFQADPQGKVIPQEYTAFIEKGTKKTEPATKAQYDRLKTDTAAFETQAADPHYTITDLDSLKQALQPLESTTASLEQLKKDIQRIANQLPHEASFKKDQYELLTLRGQLKPLTFEEIVVNFARQKPALLQERNPLLTENDLAAIYSKTAEYLLLKTHDQQRERAHRLLQKATDSRDPIEKKELVQELAITCTTKRAYTPNPEDPKTCTYLVFEYFSDLLIRSQQIEKMELFLKEGDENLVMEMIMGSGKSKVLLILLGLLRADGTNISTLVVSSPFFKDVANYTHEVNYKAFGQLLKTIHFDRETPLTKDSLNFILNTLQITQAKQDCIILTSKSMQCMLLRYLEEWFKVARSPKPEETEELRTFRNILLTLRFHNKPLIDELDTVLNVLHDVSFSMGKKVSLERAHISLIMQLYELLYTDSELKAIARLESDPHGNLSAPMLNRELYLTTLKQPLAKALIHRLATGTIPGGKYQYIRQEMTSLSESEVKALEDFLIQDLNLGDLKHTEALNCFNKLSPPLQELLVVASKEIGHLLDHTLTRPSNEKYGIDPSGLFAIPYAAANNPEIGSEFSNPLITVDYTIQSYVKNGLTKEHIRNSFELLRKEISENQAQAESSGAYQTLKDWQNRLSPLVLTFSAHTDWEGIQKKINEDVKSVLAFTEDFILPSMQFYDKKIASNPHNLTAMCNRGTGFTGTLWDASTIDRKFKAMPEAGTDSRTLAQLFSHSNTGISIINELDPGKILQHLDETNIHFDMLCDAGGYFKQQTNLYNARLMAIRYQKPVVFYHNKGQTLTDGTSEKPFTQGLLKEGEYLTFLDQINTTGADVKQKITAVSAVTIKKGMLLRDLLQAVWRMRGLEKGQKIRWIISKEVADIIRSELKLNKMDNIGLVEILDYAIQNQSNQLENNNYVSCLQQFHAVKQQLLIDELLGDTSVENKIATLNVLQSTWITEEILYNPDAAPFPRAVDTQQLIKERAQEAIKFLNDHFQESPRIQQAKDAIKSIRKRYKTAGMVPQKVIGETASLESTVTVEKEQARIAVAETAVQQEVRNIRRGGSLTLIRGNVFKKVMSKDGHIFHSVYESEIPTISLQDFFALKTNKNSPYEPRYPSSGFEKISSSFNVFEMHELDKSNINIDQIKLYSELQKEIDYIIIDQEGLLLISQEDAEKFSSNPHLYSLKSRLFLNSPRRLLTDAETDLVIKAKFLAGVSHQYTASEKVHLIEWLKDNNLVELRTFFEEVVLQSYPLAKKAYKNSWLEKQWALIENEI